MKITPTPLTGLLLVEPRVFRDERGFFLETFRTDQFPGQGLPTAFVQDNWSRSRKGVLRGLHFQSRYPQGKFVFVTRGLVYDVVVDIRSESPTFGRWYGAYLSDENHRQLYVPPGFAHGFCVLSEEADFIYKCTDIYHPEDEGGVIWNDPDLGIAWPVETPVLAEKDRAFPRLKDLPADRLPRTSPKGETP